MKIGFNEACTKECSTLKQDLQLCEQAGFDFMEIRLDMLQEYLKTHTVAQLQFFFENSQIKPHALNAIYLYEEMFSQRDDLAKREEFMQLFLFACERGMQIGAGYLVVVTPTLPATVLFSYPQKAEWVHTDCVRILHKLADVADAFGIKLCFEPVGFPRCAVRTVQQALEIVRSVDKTNVGLALDTYNLFVDGGLSNYTAISKVPKDKIFAVHINDADDLPPEQWGQDKRCFCGEGCLNIPSYLQAIQTTGYEGVVSVEVFRPEYWAKDAREVVREAYRTTQNCLRENGCL